jgi:two-component system nitrogen regulation response regulator GlnG
VRSSVPAPAAAGGDGADAVLAAAPPAPLNWSAPVPVHAPVELAAASANWLADLERESRSMLQAGVPEVWDTLTRKFEAQLIHTALEITRGRRIEAAQKLGIGRNTITRKIQELGLDD